MIYSEKPRAYAIFLDRDGVINENRADYVKSWEEFRFQVGALEALALLASTEFKLVVVSNQSAIGRGLVAREVVEGIHRRMVDQIEQAGGRVDLLLYCPHRPEENCFCRKPQPGLLLQAGEQLGLDLTESYLIGDSSEDLGAGAAVGCTCILVRTGRGGEVVTRLGDGQGNSPVVVDTLPHAVEWILKRDHLSRAEHKVHPVRPELKMRLGANEVIS
jgi:D-glycero-D-manno-heptose 1,7-bisphosphate phosphatase